MHWRNLENINEYYKARIKIESSWQD